MDEIAIDNPGKWHDFNPVLKGVNKLIEVCVGDNLFVDLPRLYDIA